MRHLQEEITLMCASHFKKNAQRDSTPIKGLEKSQEMLHAVRLWKRAAEEGFYKNPTSAQNHLDTYRKFCSWSVFELTAQTSFSV